MLSSVNELTLKRNPTYVSNVGKPSGVKVNFKYMQGLTLERNCMCVNLQSSQFPSIF
jgi:hypothetical protein